MSAKAASPQYNIPFNTIREAYITASKSPYEMSCDYQHHKLQRIEDTVQPAEPCTVIAELPAVKSKWNNGNHRTNQSSVKIRSCFCNSRP